MVKIRLLPSVFIVHAKALENATAKYPIKVQFTKRWLFRQTTGEA